MLRTTLRRHGAADLHPEPDLPRVRRQLEVDHQLEVVGCEATAGTDASRRCLLVDVELREVEGGLEEPGAALVLQGSHGVAAVGEGLLLGAEDRAREVQPGAARQRAAEGQDVQEQAQDAVAVGGIGPAVRREAGQQITRPRQHAEGP
jgi:hypothetical protein